MPRFNPSLIRVSVRNTAPEDLNTTLEDLNAALEDLNEALEDL